MTEPVIMMYPSHRKVSLINPQVSDIDIKDIAHHLSQINRYTGGSRTPYSVAAHSIYVARNLVPEEYALEALLHDATEAYLGDVSKPLKGLLPDYQAIEDRFQEVISEALGVPVKHHEEVHKADHLAYLIENYTLRSEDIDGGRVFAETMSHLDLTTSWKKVRNEFLTYYHYLNGKRMKKVI